MPYFYDYIAEIQLGDNKELEDVFNFALKQVFNQNYLSKIESLIKSRIKVKEKFTKDPGIVAWVQGTTIYVNKPEFEARDMKSKIKYILHEFLHILNNSKSFFFIHKFKEIKEMSKELWGIVLKHTKDPGKFLTGKSVSKSLLNDQEALSYLMNDEIQWSEITPEGKKLFLQTLNRYNVFNLEHEFWKKRLS